MPSHRRKFLKRAAVTGSLVGLAGCQGDGGDATPAETQTPEPGVEYEEVDAVSWLTLSREDNPGYYEEAQQAMGMLEEIGFQFDESVYESGQWVNTLFAKDYDIANIGWSNTVERLFPYYNLYFSFHSQYAGPDGGNFSNFVSDEYDQAVENFASEMDEDARQELAYRCQEILARNVPTAFTTHPSSLIAHNTEEFSGWDPMVGEWAYFNPTTLKSATRQAGDGTVVFATTAPPEQYPNFMSHTGPAAVFLHKLNYDPLVQMSTTGRPIAEGAAESWEVVDDTTIDVTLRSGMTWHDGEPVTPEDVKFTWDYATEHGIPYLASDIEPYESSEVTGENSIRFTLSNPFAGFIPVSMYRVPIIPQHVWEGVTAENDLDHPGQWENPDMTGSGPFRMVNYEPGNRIVFEKHADHYAAGEYDFDSIVYNIYGTNSTAVGDVINGNATFTQGLGYTDWQRAQNSDTAEAIENPSIQANGLFFNVNNEPFNDVLVRQAMAYALNRTEIAQTVHQGYAQPAKSPVAPANEGYHNPDVAAYEFSLQQARSLLEESGFRYEGDTLMKPVDWEPTTEYVSVSD
ncbi:ABC transporter substrate-binding protein [Halorarum halobium]|uniref:ABC transporter substrate-binding protein n=1 Tax=Halorarum halobium TaxID=3075121 RepID=UPI0028A8D16E|nr:ABC transporter substrate-binding protein [Halobaculum sp. XH14]